eukprot:CAMPEP_0116012952 /NCGR_PEP_ID=MMETSP0321-20121206/5432_1 /TAXON_ID=163516 /ORGANISM="Leptocylindrus danicus var. danicus, Strain B650" /LENGTH=344 /DNA_ID=CAMNT_0003482399 /DNA_START=719 /DNA_END=1753 /DNA_ORIENTATION=+
MTAISTLLSSIMLPVNLILYATLSSTGEENILNDIDWRSLFTALAVVCAAIASGLYFSYRNYPVKYRILANRGGMISGCILIFISFIASSFTGDDESDEASASSTEETKLWDKDWYFYVGVALPCLLGCIIATIISSLVGLKKPERVTVAVECSYQNPGIATSVALSMFEDANERALALGVPLYYGGMEAVILGVYCLICWKCGWTKAPKDENFFVMLGATYEVDNDENNIDRIDNSDDVIVEELELQRSAQHDSGMKCKESPPARSRFNTGDTSTTAHSTSRSSDALSSSADDSHEGSGDNGRNSTPLRAHLNTMDSLSQIEEDMMSSSMPDTNGVPVAMEQQ